MMHSCGFRTLSVGARPVLPQPNMFKFTQITAVYAMEGRTSARNEPADQAPQAAKWPPRSPVGVVPSCWLRESGYTFSLYSQAEEFAVPVSQYNITWVSSR